MTDQQNLSAADLDQVRNILFGRQMKESQKRADTFERTLKKELQGLHTELSKRMTLMEKSIEQQGERLNKAILEEATARDLAQEELGKKVTELKKSADERFARLNEFSARTARELKQRIVADVKTLREEIHELAEALETESADLRESQVGKEDLSAFLGDIALKLANKKQIRRS